MARGRFARNGALILLVAIVVAAPRSAHPATTPQLTPPADVSRTAARSTSPAGPIGAPARPGRSLEAVHIDAGHAAATSIDGAPHVRGSGAPSPAPRATRPSRQRRVTAPPAGSAAPTPKATPRRTSPPAPDAVLIGEASWYCLPGRSACTAGYAANTCAPPAWHCYAAAGPAIRAALGPGWMGRRVTVAAGNVAVEVVLIDWCACPDGRLLDLYASVYGQLASLSSGLLGVTVEVSR